MHSYYLFILIFILHFISFTAFYGTFLIVFIYIFFILQVFLNNEYAGIYLFVEKITQDKNRVNIKEIDEDDLSGNDLTGTDKLFI